MTVSQTTFFGSDRYAAFALGTAREVGSSFADADVYVAARGLSNSVIPDIDESVLVIEGDDAEQTAAVREVLLAPYSNRDLWSEPNLPMELQLYLSQLVERGELFVYLGFARAADASPYSLFETRWLAPETILHRRLPQGGVYEQYASRRAFEGSDYVLDGEPREFLTNVPEEDVLHLRWPLGEPSGVGTAPAEAARKLGRRVERHAEQSLLAARASAEPSETLLPVARARTGAFASALEAQKTLSARIKDLLLYPGAAEAEMFPWTDKITDYFAADRILRSRIAICGIREYLFEEFNRQVLGRWSQLNAWGHIRLALRSDAFSEADWQAMRDELTRGTTTLDDVRAAVTLEYESGHHYGRAARAS
jgi:hypothetical protein